MWWFTADEAYGQAGYLRDWLEGHGVFDVMATPLRPSDEYPATSAPAPTSSSSSSVRRPSSGSRSVPERTNPANMTGRAARSTGGGRAGTGCWPGPASAPPPRSPTTSATARPPRGWSTSPGPQGRAGTWKKRFSRPRARPDSTTTRSANGGPGMPTSPCPCSRRPGSQQRKPLRQRGTRRQRWDNYVALAQGSMPADQALHRMKLMSTDWYG